MGDNAFTKTMSFGTNREDWDILEPEDILDNEEILETLDEEEQFEGLEDVSLVFVDDTDEPLYADGRDLVVDKLGEYTFEEILDLNEIDEAEALSLLFVGGHIGLPYAVDEIDDDGEAEQDIPEEEED